MEDFLLWISKVRKESSKYKGYLDSKLIDSCGDKNERISIFRFEDRKSLNIWLNSKTHQQLITELNIISEIKTKIKSYSGLEYWFDREPQNRLMMSFLTYVGLLPLVMFVPPMMEKYLHFEGFILLALSTWVITLLMTYVVMPIIMKLYN